MIIFQDNVKVLFIVVLILLTIGLAMVYDTSATLAMWQRAKGEAAPTAPGDRTTLQKSKPDSPSGNEAGIIKSYHSGRYLVRQALWVLLGLLVLFCFYAIDYARWQSLANVLIVVAGLLLIIVLTPLGLERHGAQRWLGYKFLTFQPSEFAKLALIIFMAHQLSKRHQQQLRSFGHTFLPLAACLGVVLGLVFLEPDFGMTALIAVMVAILWFVGGMRPLHLLTVGIGGLLLGAVAILIEPYRLKRLIAFFKIEEHAQGSAYQIKQSLISLGSGGLWGKGLGNGLQKYHFLSQAHTDFIFAIIGEELGLIGASAIILLYLAVLLIGLRIIMRTPDQFAALVATGIVVMIVISAAINLLVVTAAIPPKGLPLPFISYGGSSMLVNMAAIGILMNIAKYGEVPLRRR